MTKQQIKRLRAGVIVTLLLLLPGIAVSIQNRMLTTKNAQMGLSASGAPPATPAMMAAMGEKPKDGYTRLSFDTLRSWVYVEGKTPIPPEIKALDGKNIEMLGFMMPLTEVKNIKEFLLVPSLWGCCYGQPPAPNHMVAVKMPEGKTTKFFQDVIRVRGNFKVSETRQEGYLVSLYVLTPTEIETP
jgi:hypothetical protein